MINENIEKGLYNTSNQLQSLINIVIDEIKKVRDRKNLSESVLFYLPLYNELNQIQDKVSNLLEQYDSLKNQSDNFIKNHFLTFGLNDFLSDEATNDNT